MDLFGSVFVSWRDQWLVDDAIDANLPFKMVIFPFEVHLQVWFLWNSGPTIVIGSHGIPLTTK